MANKKYIVELSSDERARLTAMISKGQCSAQANLKARILLKSDQGAFGESLCDATICEALETNVRMVERVRQKCVLEGLEAVFKRKKRQTPPRVPIFDGEAEARLIALACSEPPQGYARWSIRLLADKVVELGIVEKAHHNTIARTLKKRTQAASQPVLGNSTWRERSVRRRHGRYIVRLHAATRPPSAVGLPR